MSPIHPRLAALPALLALTVASGCGGTPPESNGAAQPPAEQAEETKEQRQGRPCPRA